MYWLDSKGTSSLQSSALGQLSVFSVSPSVSIKILQRLSHSVLQPDSLERLRNGAGELALCKCSYIGLAVYACKPNTEQKKNKQIQRTACLKYHTSCSMRDLSQDNREGSDREIEAFTGLSVCVLVYAHTCIHHSHTVYPPKRKVKD